MLVCDSRDNGRITIVRFIFDQGLNDPMIHLIEFQSPRPVHSPLGTLVAAAMVATLAAQMLLLFDNNFDDPVLLRPYHQ